ncbi:MAG TPA: hypothetical protein VGE07_10555 [Herpetosiphonaceae bacterium]
MRIRRVYCWLVAVALLGLALPGDPVAPAARAQASAERPAAPIALRDIGGIGGEPGNPVLLDGYLYVNVANRLEIYDALDAPEPRLRGSVTLPVGGLQLEIDSARRLAFVAGGSLAIVDIGDPERPRLVGQYATNVDGPVRVAGTTAYLVSYDRVSSTSTLEIIDVANPAQPIRRGGYAVAANLWINDVLVAGNRAYLTTNSYGQSKPLLILDVGNPAAPALLGTLPVASSDRDGLHLAGNLLYVGGPKLAVVDVGNPAQPAVRGELAPAPHGVEFKDIRILGDYGYAVIESGDPRDPEWLSPRLIKISLADPVSPAFSGQAMPFLSEGLDYIHGIDAAGGVVVMTTSLGIRTYDPTRNFQPLGYYAALKGITAIHRLRDPHLAYVMAENQLYLYDLTNLAMPIRMAALSGTFASVAVSGTALYATRWNGLPALTYDISDPAHPRQTASSDWFSGELQVVGTRLYARWGYDLIQSDVTQPLAPVFVNKFSPLGANPYWSAQMSGARGAIRSNVGMFAVDMSATPPVTGTILPLPYRTWTIPETTWELRGTTAYAAGYAAGFVAADLSAPDSPRQVFQHPAPAGQQTFSLAMDGDIAVVNSTVMDILDLRDPARPALLQRLPNPYDYTLLKLEGNKLFGSSGFEGLLRIMQLDGLPLARTYLPATFR